MSKSDTLAAACIALVNAIADNDEDIKSKSDPVVSALNDMKAMKRNFSRVKKTLEGEYDDIADGMVGWLDESGSDVKERDAWRASFAPAPVTPVTSPGADIKTHASSVRGLGIKIQLPKYSGARGECASWWLQLKRTFVTMKVPEDDLFALVVDALEGDALAEFWHGYNERERNRRGSGPDVEAIMLMLIGLFDAGQHVLLLKKWRLLEQRKGETVLKFRARYMRVLDALAQYHWSLTDDQVVADFGSRLLDWARIATHQPTSMQGILRAVAELGENTDAAPKPQLMVVGGIRQNSKCWNCGSSAHMSRECTKPRAARKCFRCKSEKHLIADCDQPDTREHKSSASNRE